jgi:predicted DsbA family dithiol-disulfide isomerase
VERWRGALGLLGDVAAQVSWRYAAFELDPNVPPEGVEARAYMQGKYPPAMMAEMQERLAHIARQEGLPFGAQAVRPNTFDAHRLLGAAMHDGAALQQALADELFAAHWSRGENVGLAGVLADAAAAVGMPASAADAVLNGDDYAAEVRAEERLASDLGIHAVPTFVIADRLMVSGAQSPQVLADAIRQASGSG